MSLGFEPATYWTLTPRELDLIIQGGVRRERRQRNRDMTVAYYAAIVPYSKTPIKLEDLLIPEDATPPRRMSWQEIKAGLVLAIGEGKKEDVTSAKQRHRRPPRRPRAE